MKKEIRRKILEKRSNLTLKEKEEFSTLISEKLFTTEDFINCKNLLIYIDFNNEVITKHIIDKAIKSGKNVGIPYCNTKTKEMDFILFNGYDKLNKSKYGTMEPFFDNVNKENNKIITSNEETIIIVPLSAFDSELNRIGYGGGYYDRYLSKNIYHKAIGIGFNLQHIKSITPEKYDIKLDYVITEEQIWKR